MRRKVEERRRKEKRREEKRGDKTRQDKRWSRTGKIFEEHGRLRLDILA